MTTWYVSATGVNGDGSESSPWVGFSNIDWASVSTNDTIKFTGMYFEEAEFIPQTSNITLDGLNITRSSNGIGFIANVEDLVIQNSEFLSATSHPGDFIRVNASNLSLIDTEIDMQGNGDEAILISSGSSIQNIVVNNVRIAGVSGDFDSGNLADAVTVDGRNASNILHSNHVYENVTISTTYDAFNGIHLDARGGTNSGCKDFVIKDCNISGVSRGIGVIHSTGAEIIHSGHKIINNLVYDTDPTVTNGVGESSGGGMALFSDSTKVSFNTISNIDGQNGGINYISGKDYEVSDNYIDGVFVTAAPAVDGQGLLVTGINGKLLRNRIDDINGTDDFRLNGVAIWWGKGGVDGAQYYRSDNLLAVGNASHKSQYAVNVNVGADADGNHDLYQSTFTEIERLAIAVAGGADSGSATFKNCIFYAKDNHSSAYHAYEVNNDSTVSLDHEYNAYGNFSPGPSGNIINGTRAESSTRPTATCTSTPTAHASAPEPSGGHRRLTSLKAKMDCVSRYLPQANRTWALTRYARMQATHERRLHCLSE